MNTFSANNEQPRLYLSGYFRSIRFCFTAEALQWLSGTTSDDSNRLIANQTLFYDLLRRMRFTAGRNDSFRRPQWVQAGAFQFSEIRLAADWNMGRKRVHNLLLIIERVGLIAVSSSRIASIAAMVCVEGWTDKHGNFVKNPYSPPTTIDRVSARFYRGFFKHPYIPLTTLIASPSLPRNGSGRNQGKEVCEICQDITFAAATVILGALAAHRRLSDTALAGSHLDCYTN